MFVKASAVLRVPFARAVETVTQQQAEAWLPGLVLQNGDFERGLLVDVGFGGGRARVGRRVEVQLGSWVDVPPGVLIPISWRAAEATELFPRMEADLMLAPMGASITQLSICGRYTPPLAGLGQLLDRALLHRIAEATINDFLARTAHLLAGELGLESGPAPSGLSFGRPAPAG